MKRGKVLKKKMILRGLLISIYFFMIIKTMFTLSLAYLELSTFTGVKYLLITIVSIVMYLTFWKEFLSNKDDNSKTDK